MLPTQYPTKAERWELSTGLYNCAFLPAELPIVVMNVMSLSAQKAQLRSENQPEPEMGQNPAEPRTSE